MKDAVRVREIAYRSVRNLFRCCDVAGIVSGTTQLRETAKNDTLSPRRIKSAVEHGPVSVCLSFSPGYMTTPCHHCSYK